VKNKNESYLQGLLAHWSTGQRLTRGERRDLEMYVRVKTLEELEHICDAVGGEDGRNPSDGN
jgi:hypothetical protein